MNTLDSTFIRFLIYHLVSGNAFYLAVLLLTVAVAVRVFRRRPLTTGWRVALRLVAAFGVIALLLTLSSVTILWLLFLLTLPVAAGIKPALRKRIFFAAIALQLAAIVFSWRYETQHVELRAGDKPLVIFGDSLCVAYNVREEETWPRLIADRMHREVINRGRAGAHLVEILRFLDEQTPENSVVLMEGGGNDSLTGTPLAKYAEQLDEIYDRLREHNNQVIAFEVPALPTAPAYAWVQKRVAARHGVTLLPKRMMAGVIFGKPGTTVDNLHLSPSGHQRMADFIIARMK